MGDTVDLVTAREGLSAIPEEEEEEEEKEAHRVPTQKQRSKKRAKRTSALVPSKEAQAIELRQKGKMTNLEKFKKLLEAPEEVPRKRKLALGPSTILEK